MSCTRLMSRNPPNFLIRRLVHTVFILRKRFWRKRLVSNAVKVNYSPSNDLERNNRNRPVIDSLKSCKTFSHDGIGNIILKFSCLYNLINSMMKPHHIRSQWKLTTVLCITKHIWPNYSQAHKHVVLYQQNRWKIILLRLEDLTDANCILLDFQHGFCRKPDWEHQLSRVTAIKVKLELCFLPTSTNW